MASLPVVKRVKLGSQGFEVSELGLGCMGMSAFYGPAKPEKEMIELIHQAVSSGVTLLDTADAYGPHTNEVLIGKAVKGIRDKVQIATKFGNSVTAERKIKVRGDPEYVRTAFEGSLRRLDVDYIDLYYQHRVDPQVPIEITVGEMKKFVEAGKVKYLGLSEASSADIRRAHAVHPISAVQIEWSLWSRDIEEDIVSTCRELGIGIVSYSPLGRGFLSGVKIAELDVGDFRTLGSYPRLTGENLVKNQEFFKRLVKIGKKHGKTPGQVALAWVKHQGVDVVPIPGTTKPKNLEENIAALDLKFTKEEIQEIETAVPHENIAGERYADMTTTWRNTTSPPLSSWQPKA